MLKEIFAFLGFTSPFFFFLYKRGKKKHTFRMGFMDPKNISAPCASAVSPPSSCPLSLQVGKSQKRRKGEKKGPGPRCWSIPEPTEQPRGWGTRRERER